MPATTNQSQILKCRIKQARKAKSWTMTRLADEVGLTRQSISQFEKGDAKPSPEKLREIAKKLEQPAQYFTWQETYTKESPATFRSMASSTTRAREQTESWIELLASIVSFLSGTVNFPKVSLPDVQIPDFTRLTNDDIDNLALETRRHFGLGNGPISNLTLLLENNGIIVGFKKLNKSLDGISQWYNNRPYVLVDPTKSASKTRFSVAHELGHIVMHQQLSSESELMDKELHKLIESQANYYASSLAMPESSLANEVYGTDWNSLIELKSRWKMSISCIAMRLHSIGLISESQKIRIFRELSARNARKNEPLDKDIPQDLPRLIKKVANFLDAENVLSTDSLRDSIPINLNLLSELSQVPVEALLPKSVSNNVISLRR